MQNPVRCSFGRNILASSRCWVAINAALLAVCDLSGRDIVRSDGGPAVAYSVAPIASGTRKLLLIRVDFSDRSGASVAAEDARRIFSERVEPFLLRASFGTLKLAATVSDKVYLMPKTAAAYEAQADPLPFHADARAAAATDHDLTSFDFVMVAFPELRSGGMIYTGWEEAGLGLVGAGYSWINGAAAFTDSTLVHELLHNCGSAHAYSASAENGAITIAGAKQYGDIADIMGLGNAHPNPAIQAALGWLPPEGRVTPAAGRHTVRLFTQPATAVPSKFPVAATYTDSSGTPYWVFPRMAPTGGVGVTILVQTPQGTSDADTITIETNTANGSSQFMRVGDYYADPESGIMITVQATGTESGVPYADCAFEIPALGAPRLTTAPSITETTNTVHLVAGSSDPTATVRWEKRYAGAADWTEVAGADLAAPATASDLELRANSGIADIRYSATNAAGGIVSNPVRITSLPLLSPVAVDIGASRQEFVAAVNTSGSWTLTTDASWLTATPSSGTGPGLIQVAVAENVTGAARQGTLTLGHGTQTIVQSSAGAENNAVFAAGSAVIGPDVVTVTRPYLLGSGFTAMTSPGIFTRNDGTRWAVGRQMMRDVSADWMSATRHDVDRVAGIGTLIRVPDDVAAFAYDSNGFNYLVLKKDGRIFVNTVASDLGAPADTARLIATGGVRLACGTTAMSYVDANGDLWAWGRNPFGEVGDGTETERATPVRVARNVVDVSACTHQHWYVTADGSITGLGKQCFSSLGTPIGFETGVRKVAAGGVHTLILKADGTVWAVGRGQEGQLGNGGWSPYSVPVLTATNIKDVSVVIGASYLLRNDGVLLTCGDNRFGQLGDGRTINRNRPIPVDRDVVALFENVYLKSDGTLWATGGSLSAPPSTKPTEGWSRVAASARQVAAGRSLLWRLDASSQLWATGMAQDGGASTTDWVLVETDVQSISANTGSDWITFRKTNGELWGTFWTANFYWARLNFGSDAARAFFSAPAMFDTEEEAFVTKADGSFWRATWKIPLPSGASVPTYTRFAGTNIVRAVYDPSGLVCLDESGVLMAYSRASTGSQVIARNVVELQGLNASAYCYRINDGTLIGVGILGLSGRPVIATGVAAFSLGSDHVVYQTANGMVWGVGASGAGQLGRNAGVAPPGGPVLIASAAESFASTGGTTLVLGKARDLAVPSGEGGRLANLSSRGPVMTGNAMLTAGFVVGGTEPRSLLLRAVGPTLGKFGVQNPIANPRFDVVANERGTLLLSNDDWSDAPSVTLAGTRAGAFPLTAHGADAAALEAFGPGSYSVRTTAPASSAGVALVEIYEVGTGGGSRLVNLSTRAFVGTGESALVSGLVITGGARRVLIRAVGPGLARFGVTGTLPDPVVTITDTTGSVIATNDNWNASAVATQIPTVGQTVSAFALEAGSADAAVIVTLPPGGYTATVTDSRGGTGIALLEIYDVP